MPGEMSTTDEDECPSFVFLGAWDYCYDLSIATSTISATSAIAEVSRRPSYYRARYSSNPHTGKFLSVDPMGFNHGYGEL